MLISYSLDEQLGQKRYVEFEALAKKPQQPFSLSILLLLPTSTKKTLFLSWDVRHGPWQNQNQVVNLKKGSIKLHKLIIKNHLIEKGKASKGKVFMIWLCDERWEARPGTQKDYWKVMIAVRVFLSHH